MLPPWLTGLRLTGERIRRVKPLTCANADLGRPPVCPERGPVPSGRANQVPVRASDLGERRIDPMGDVIPPDAVGVWARISSTAAGRNLAACQVRCTQSKPNGVGARASHVRRTCC